MTSKNNFSEKFKESYKNIKDLHISKTTSSIDLVHKFSNEIDKLISSEIDINYRSSGIAILALGGYGRRELCIKSDIDIGKVDPNYLFKVLTKMDHKNSDALFVSCTALPILSILDKLEKKIKKIVLSSNQTLIWDALEKIGENNSIKGFGKLFNSN